MLVRTTEDQIEKTHKPPFIPGKGEPRIYGGRGPKVRLTALR